MAPFLRLSSVLRRIYAAGPAKDHTARATILPSFFALSLFRCVYTYAVNYDSLLKYSSGLANFSKTLSINVCVWGTWERVSLHFRVRKIKKFFPPQRCTYTEEDQILRPGQQMQMKRSHACTYTHARASIYSWAMRAYAYAYEINTRISTEPRGPRVLWPSESEKAISKKYFVAASAFARERAYCSSCCRCFRLF